MTYYSLLSLSLGDEPSTSSTITSSDCTICGDVGASMHYGALSCVGCKGFFRRALKKVDQIDCIDKGNCSVKVGERNTCRSCRLKKCLEAGMRPSAVQPDRPLPLKLNSKGRTTMKKKKNEDKNEKNNKDDDEDWSKRLSVEMKTMLMTLQNLETKIAKGDSSHDATVLYPLNVNTLEELIRHPSSLNGNRSQIRYEPYRMAANDELSSIAYRRLIAAVDWVQLLSELVSGGISIEDRIALVKSSFAPLMVFCFAARTAQNTRDNNVLCLCNLSYVPRDMAKIYSDSYHLANGIVGRTLDELVSPYRDYGILEEEIVCISAMIVLNPLARDLSEEGQDKVLNLRHRVSDALYSVIKEARQSSKASVSFGSLLLTLVPVAHLANCMCENLQFAQTFSTGSSSLLTNLFGSFPVEPFPHQLENGWNTVDKETQTVLSMKVSRGKRRRDGDDNIDDLEEDTPQEKEFRLLQAPGHYTLTEMFHDLEDESDQPSTSYSSTMYYTQNTNSAPTSSTTFPEETTTYETISSSFQSQSYQTYTGHN